VNQKSARFLLPPLTLFGASQATGQDSLRYRFQFYDEQDGRVDVESHYLDLKYGVSENWALGLRFAIDSLSGMTPTGRHADGDPNDWTYAEIDDERVVSVLTIDHEIDDHTLTFEYARSEEEDYLSNAFALKLRSELFQKNTTLTAGVAVGLDKVLLNTRTILDVTLGYGRSEGYLADPYRGISEVFSFGGSEITSSFPENRPDELDRWVIKVAGRHYFPGVDAALAGSYRFFANSDNVEGHTFDIKWIQQVGEKLTLTPYFRYYQQSAASYYTPTLTNTGIFGKSEPDGQAPFYSSDYRLSAFEAVTFGFRCSYQLTEDVDLEFQYERYETSRRTSRTAKELFPKANVFSAGVQWNF